MSDANFMPNVQDEPRPWLARAVLPGARIVTAMVVGSGALLGLWCIYAKVTDRLGLRGKEQTSIRTELIIRPAFFSANGPTCEQRAAIGVVSKGNRTCLAIVKVVIGKRTVWRELRGEVLDVFRLLAGWIKSPFSD
jgi:hypothetical protein